MKKQERIESAQKRKDQEYRILEMETESISNKNNVMPTTLNGFKKHP